jgi:hypothetical protein
VHAIRCRAGEKEVVLHWARLSHHL